MADHTLELVTALVEALRVDLGAVVVAAEVQGDSVELLLEVAAAPVGTA